MAEISGNTKERYLTIHHLRRGEQVGIYLGKLLRMFIYQSDWKVLPMAALIAGLVGMVIRNRLFITMEGTVMGAFAMVMVCIWNGCFNSIQVICRERDVIKREHRSGMHISAYICSHMIYQALLCLLQTGVTLYMTKIVGVKYVGSGLFTPFMIVDFGISMFLITYASDMMSLWISCLARSTTTAMTVMPFILIFQLVFSGGMLSLPAWTNYLTPFTISNPALKVLAAQSDYNHRPVNTIWDTVNGMRSKEVSVTITVGQVLDLLQNDKVSAVAAIRQANVSDYVDAETLLGEFGAPELAMLLGDDLKIDMTMGELIDKIAQDPGMISHRDESTTVNSTVGDLINMIGEEKVKNILRNEIADSNKVSAYENTPENILKYWLRLVTFILAFAALSVITLEFIDKDKR